MKKRIIFLLLFLIFFIGINSAKAEEEYVAWINGVGYTSLHEATEAAVDGDIIVLGEGEYSLYGTPKAARVGKTLTFVGKGADKTKWYIGAAVPETEGTINYNSDYSLDGAEKATFKNMTIQLGTKDYLGYVRLNHSVFEECVINGKMEYNGYESATFINSTLNCPNNDYCIWTYTSPVITFDGCTFNSSGKTINVYSNATNIGDRDIIVNFNNNIVNGTSTGKTVLNINDNGRNENSKFIINITGVNETNDIIIDDLNKGKLSENTTCSRLFEFGRDSYNTGKTIVNIDGVISWGDGLRKSFDYVANYSGAVVVIDETDWDYSDSNNYYTKIITKTCTVCGINDVEELKAYIITYTDGVDNEIIFEDQVNDVVIEGSVTPPFNGDTPVRNGYVFKGWDKSVSGEVHESVTYTAVWEKNDSRDINNPPTRDNIIFYIFVLGISIIGLLGIYIKKRFN